MKGERSRRQEVESEGHCDCSEDMMTVAARMVMSMIEEDVMQRQEGLETG